MKRLVKIVVPVLIISLSIGIFMLLRASRPVQPSAQIDERIWRVAVMTVQPRSLTPSLTLYGKLETPSMFLAAAPVSARVDQVLVKEGERVSEGQLLIALDERDFQPRLDQASAEVAELEAQLESEQIRHRSDISALDHEKRLLELSSQGVNRLSRLQQQKLGSDSALDEARQALARQALSLTSRELSIADHPARYQALEARLERARARRAEIALEFERSKVFAPFAGLVEGVDVATGNRVKANDPLLRLYDPDSLELRARIPAPYTAELQRILAAGHRPVGETQVAGERIRLKLLRLAGKANPSGIDALFAIEQGGAWLRAGQVLRFNLQRMPQQDAVAVPYPAVYGGDRLYTLREGRLQGLPAVTLGSFVDRHGEELLLVRSPGLQPGDQLVVTHLPNAIDGLRAEAVVAQ